MYNWATGNPSDGAGIYHHTHTGIDSHLLEVAIVNKLIKYRPNSSQSEISYLLIKEHTFF
jgi:hypothetical protein